MKSKAIILVGMALLSLLVYYLFVVPYEFEVTLKAKTSPGDIVQTIRLWDRSLDDARIIKVDSFAGLQQSFAWKSKSYVFNWFFKVIDDSTTKIIIRISEPGRELANKIWVPFTRQPIETNAEEVAKTFRDLLDQHLEITKVKLYGEARLDSIFCVCRTLATEQIEKANGMMRDYDILASFVESGNLTLQGAPVVRINQWSHQKGTISFDFCFPILKTHTLPQNESFQYKYFKSERTLKAEYSGNYITSDRAWYELIKLAQSKGYTITGLPIEYFYDNPNLGMNERNWRADVYLPIN